MARRILSHEFGLESALRKSSSVPALLTRVAELPIIAAAEWRREVLSSDSMQNWSKRDNWTAVLFRHALNPLACAQSEQP